MKKITLTILIIFLSYYSFSQSNENSSNVTISTSLEEYNYMTKGIKIQFETGLDMKKGYELEHITTIQRSSYSFDFKALKRIEENNLAGILIIANSKVSGRTYYLGMPINNQELQEKFEEDIRYWDESMTTAFAQSVSDLYAQASDYFYNKRKN